MTNAILASTFAMAQPDGAGSGGGGGQAAEAAEGVAEGGQGGAAPGMCGGMSSTTSIIMMVLMFAVFYFLLIRPQQKKAKEHQKMIDSIGKGTEVVTNGGLIGRVTGVAGKTLTMEVSEKVRVRVLRGQVAGVYTPDNVEKK